MKRLKENPVYERPELADVYNFAKAKHDATGAVRKNSGLPYWVHPSMVADVCLAYGGTDEEVALALLHDTAEDTATTYEEVALLYGEDVAELLSEITNDPEEVKRLGKEEYINQELVELDHPALFVKLCDMYANSLDAPKPGQAERMKRNLEYLLTYRDDLTDKERRLIKSFPLMSEYNLDHNEFEDGLDDEDYFKDGFLYASRKMPNNILTEEELQEGKLKKAALIAMMSLGLITSAFAKSKKAPEPKTITMPEFIEYCIEFADECDEQGYDYRDYSWEDVLDELDAQNITVKGIIPWGGDGHAVKGMPGIIQGRLRSKKALNKMLTFDNAEIADVIQAL